MTSPVKYSDKQNKFWKQASAQLRPNELAAQYRYSDNISRFGQQKAIRNSFNKINSISALYQRVSNVSESSPQLSHRQSVPRGQLDFTIYSVNDDDPSSLVHCMMITTCECSPTSTREPIPLSSTKTSCRRLVFRGRQHLVEMQDNNDKSV